MANLKFMFDHAGQVVLLSSLHVTKRLMQTSESGNDGTDQCNLFQVRRFYQPIGIRWPLRLYHSACFSGTDSRLIVYRLLLLQST